MKKINLGSGSDYREGFVNVDFDQSVKADVYADLRKKLPFRNGSVDYILLQDVLEHLTRESGKELLKECARILKIGGKIEIRIPDIYKIFDQFSGDPGVLFRFVYGNTSKNGDLGAHKYGYSATTLTKTLKSTDFWPVEIREETTNIICIAKKIKSLKPPEKIAISLLDSGGFGGAENFIYQLTEELLGKIKNIEFLIFLDSVPKDIKVTKTKFPWRLDFIGNIKGFVKSIILSPLYIISVVLWIYKFKRSGGKLILLTGISDKVFISPFAKIMGISLIWVEFGPLKEVFKRNFYIPKILYRLVKNLPDFVICPSENTRKSLISDCHISESKLEIIPCGINLRK